jgi:hypothetical protein
MIHTHRTLNKVIFVQPSVFQVEQRAPFVKYAFSSEIGSVTDAVP